MGGFTVSRQKAVIEKDPNDSLDYMVDMSEFLLDDTISTVEHTESGVTVDTATPNLASVDVVIDGVTRTIEAYKAAVFWLSGGTVGSDAFVSLRITSVGGRIKDITFPVLIKQE